MWKIERDCQKTKMEDGAVLRICIIILKFERLSMLPSFESVMVTSCKAEALLYQHVPACTIASYHTERSTEKKEAIFARTCLSHAFF